MHLEPHHVAALRARYGSAYVTHALCDLHSNKGGSAVMELLGANAEATLHKHIAPHCAIINGGLDALANSSYPRLMEGIAKGYMHFNVDSIKKLLSDFAYRVVTSPRALVGALFAAAKQVVAMLAWLFPEGSQEHESVEELKEQVESSASERDVEDWSWSSAVASAFNWITTTLSKWVGFFSSGLSTLTSWCVGWLGTAVETICNGGIVKEIKGVAKHGFFIIFYCYNLITAGVHMGNRERKEARAHLRACAGNLPTLIQSFAAAMQGGATALLANVLRILAATPLFQSIMGTVVDVTLKAVTWLANAVSYVFTMLVQMLQKLLAYAKPWAERFLGDLLIEKLSFITNVVRRFAFQLYDSLPSLPSGNGKEVPFDKMLEAKIAETQRYLEELKEGTGLQPASEDQRHKYSNTAKKAIRETKLFLKEQKEYQASLIHTSQSAWDAATIQSACWVGEDPLGSDPYEPNELRDRYYRHNFGYSFEDFNNKVSALADSLELAMFQQLSDVAGAEGRVNVQASLGATMPPTPPLSEQLIGQLPSNYKTLSVEEKIQAHQAEIYRIRAKERYGEGGELIANEMAQFKVKLVDMQETVSWAKAQEAEAVCQAKLDELSGVTAHEQAIVALKREASSKYRRAWWITTTVVVLTSLGVVGLWIWYSRRSAAQAEMEMRLKPIQEKLYEQDSSNVLRRWIIERKNAEAPPDPSATDMKYLASLAEYRNAFMNKLNNIDTYDGTDFIKEVHGITQQQINALETAAFFGETPKAIRAVGYDIPEQRKYGKETFLDFSPNDDPETRSRKQAHNAWILKMTKGVWSALTPIYQNSITAVSNGLGQESPLSRFYTQEGQQAFSGLFTWIADTYASWGGFGLTKTDANVQKLIDQILNGQAIWVAQWISAAGGGLLFAYASLELLIMMFGGLVTTYYSSSAPLAADDAKDVSFSGMVIRWAQKASIAIAVPALFIGVSKIVIGLMVTTTITGTIIAWFAGPAVAITTFLPIASGAVTVIGAVWYKLDWFWKTSHAFYRAQPVVSQFTKGIESALIRLWKIENDYEARRFVEHARDNHLIQSKVLENFERQSIKARKEAADAKSVFAKKPQEATTEDASGDTEMEEEPRPVSPLPDRKDYDSALKWSKAVVQWTNRHPKKK